MLFLKVSVLERVDRFVVVVNVVVVVVLLTVHVSAPIAILGAPSLVHDLITNKYNVPINLISPSLQ